MFLIGTALSSDYLYFEDLLVDTCGYNYSFLVDFSYINMQCLLLFLIMIIGLSFFFIFYFFLSFVLIGINIAKPHAAMHIEFANSVPKGGSQRRM